MRGKVPLPLPAGRLQGITPAYAGKRRVPTRPTSPNIGSPPRMRGKVFCGCHGMCPPRITPAYAGKSPADRDPDICVKDHPRVCGEKLLPRVVNFFAEGSPPRMRGKVKPLPITSGIVGITPAYAGKRTQMTLLDMVREDHPRVCGEKLRGDSEMMTSTGSPPRMRGKVLILVNGGAFYGITPAYAGKS